MGLIKLPSSNNLQVLQYFWAVVQCSFCNDRWKGKPDQEKKYSWTSPLTTATLGAEESDHCREVAVVERFKWESMYGLSVCLSVCLSFSGGSTEPQVYIARRRPWKCYMYMNELSREITEFHPQTKNNKLWHSPLLAYHSHIFLLMCLFNDERKSNCAPRRLSWQYNPYFTRSFEGLHPHNVLC